MSNLNDIHVCIACGRNFRKDDIREGEFKCYGCGEVYCITLEGRMMKRKEFLERKRAEGEA